MQAWRSSENPYTDEFTHVKDVYPSARQELLTDPRIVKTSIGHQIFKGGDRFVIRAHTIPLSPLERKGFKGKVQDVPVLYPINEDYLPVARPAYPALRE